jgi:hypothetical protein
MLLVSNSRDKAQVTSFYFSSSGKLFVRPEHVFKLLTDLGRSLCCLLATFVLGTYVVPLVYQSGT